MIELEKNDYYEIFNLNKDKQRSNSNNKFTRDDINKIKNFEDQNQCSNCIQNILDDKVIQTQNIELKIKDNIADFNIKNSRSNLDIPLNQEPFNGNYSQRSDLKSTEIYMIANNEPDKNNSNDKQNQIKKEFEDCFDHESFNSITGTFLVKNSNSDDENF